MELPGLGSCRNNPSCPHGRGIPLDSPQGLQDDLPQEDVEAGDQQQVEQQRRTQRVEHAPTHLLFKEAGAKEDFHIANGFAHGHDRAFLHPQSYRADRELGRHRTPLWITNPGVGHEILRVGRVDLFDDHTINVLVLHGNVEDLADLGVVEIP